MTIEIFGAGFKNKGAELMLRTTVAKLRNQQPNVRLAVEPGVDSPFELRSELQLANIFPTITLMPRNMRRVLLRSSLASHLVLSSLRAILPKSIDKTLGLVDRRNADALLDISGYSFGDKFHWRRCKKAAERAALYSRKKKPVIFMPQMFGPFEHPKTRRYFKKCCDHATLIYAREEASLEAVRNLIGNDSRLKLAPDITIFSPTTPPIEIEVEDKNYAIIVPNEKMLDSGQKEWGGIYLERLFLAGKQMHKRGLRPVVLIHSMDPGDEKLARQLIAKMETELGEGTVSLFQHPNPFVLKSFIAKAKFLVGSRFHSLVAALSSAVPGVALGWAHKYDMLAQDFGVPMLIHRGKDSPEHLVNLLDDLANEEKNVQIRNTLKAKREGMRSASEAMWNDVFQALGLPEENRE